MSLQRTLTLLEYRLPPITVRFGRAVMPVEGNAFQVAAVDGASVLAWFLASSFYGGGNGIRQHSLYLQTKKPARRRVFRGSQRF
jgi:hypothetical protein